MEGEEFKRYEWGRWDDSKKEASKGLDNIIFVVGTGLFVLSFNLVLGLKDIIFVHTEFIIFSWALLTTSILAHARSYQCAVKKADFVQKKLKEWDGISDFNLDEDDEDKRLRRAVDLMNEIAFWSLVLGVLFLLGFAVLNLSTHVFSSDILLV